MDHPAARASTVDRGPGSARPGQFDMAGGVSSVSKAYDGDWADFWLYDDLVYPFRRAVGRGRLRRDLGATPVTFDEIRPGCWKQAERLADMDDNHVDASICFPNTLPRFCGQAFAERDDKELALLCVKAYNDWMIDEWCAGDGPRPADPAHDRAAVGRRARGGRGAALRRQGQPRHHVLARTRTRSGCRRSTTRATSGTRSSRRARRPSTIVCMHIGSSSQMPSTSPDAPFIVSSTLTFQNAMGSLLDFCSPARSPASRT